MRASRTLPVLAFVATLAVGVAHLVLLFREYGTDALFAISLSPNKYIFVPIFLPFVAAFLTAALGEFLKALGAAFRFRPAWVAGGIGAIALLAGVATAVVFATNDMGPDRIEKTHYAEAKPGLARLLRHVQNADAKDRRALTESLRSLSERLRAKPRRLELVCSQPAQADSAIKANLGAAPFDDDEVKSIRAYYCGAIFNPSTRLSAKVVDAIEYLFDATIALGVLGLGLVITMFIRRKHGDDKWKPSTKNASLLLVLATIILLLWPPMTAASGDWIHTFDPELTLINPMSLVPLYLIMLVTLTLHYVTKTGEKLISALAAVLAAAFNAIAVFNPALVGRLFSMDDIGSFAFFTACTLIELSILAVIAYTLGGNAPDATVRS